MNVRLKTFLWCGVAELPLLAALVGALSGSSVGLSLPLALLVAFHFVPMGALYLVLLLLFGHSAPSGGTPFLWQTLYWVFVFLIQTGLMFWVASAFQARRKTPRAA